MEIVMCTYSIITSKCTFNINCALLWCHSLVLLEIMSTIIKISLGNNYIESDINTNYVLKYSFRL